MGRDFADVIMNPVRQRIAQYLILHRTGTVSEIAAALSDVPRPSLYRHMNVLLEAGCIEVVAQKSVRGAVERTYALVEQPMGNPSQLEVAGLIHGVLTSVMASFARYFSHGDVDPQKDLLSVSSSTLRLSDQEMMEMLQRIGGVFNDYIQNAPGGERKPRNIVFISAPVEGERELKSC